MQHSRAGRGSHANPRDHSFSCTSLNSPWKWSWFSPGQRSALGMLGVGVQAKATPRARGPRWRFLLHWYSMDDCRGWDGAPNLILQEVLLHSWMWTWTPICVLAFELKFHRGDVLAEGAWQRMWRCVCVWGHVITWFLCCNHLEEGYVWLWVWWYDVRAGMWLLRHHKYRPGRHSAWPWPSCIVAY